MEETADSNEVRSVLATTEEINNCMFQEWYPKFESLTICSRFIRIPEEFLEYLNSDGICLPGDLPQWRDAESDSSEWSEDETDAIPKPQFDLFEADISQAIRLLGGKVFVKLNWSSPKDASWIALNNSLACSNFSDICLLLKSSTFVGHDLVNPYEFSIDELVTNNVQYYLVLRQWIEIDPSMEYRCFVRGNNLIAVTQRDVQQFHRYMVDQGTQITDEINNFFVDNLCGEFASENFVFDVYRPRPGVIKLVDINPFCSQTDPLLFTWSELNRLVLGEPTEFRCIREDAGIQPSPYRRYAVPQDATDLAHGTDPYKLMDLMNLAKSRVQDDGESSTTDVDR